VQLRQELQLLVKAEQPQILPATPLSKRRSDEAATGGMTRKEVEVLLTFERKIHIDHSTNAGLTAVAAGVSPAISIVAAAYVSYVSSGMQASANRARS